jgi:purine-cytosine permease-like protein
MCLLTVQLVIQIMGIVTVSVCCFGINITNEFQHSRVQTIALVFVSQFCSSVVLY